MKRLLFMGALLATGLIFVGFAGSRAISALEPPTSSPHPTATPRPTVTPAPTVTPTLTPTPLATATMTSTPAPTATPLPAVGAGFWHTDGTRIVDAYNRQVRIAGVTWYGMESGYWVPAGLDYQPYTTIMDLVKHEGYNTIRLPFSNELIEKNPIVSDKVGANSQFLGVHAIDVMDAIVVYAQQIGLKIILDDHRCNASRPSNVNLLEEPLWYTKDYPESAWIRDWVELTWRYKNDTSVIGFDLRNEPHSMGPGAWDMQAYLHRGATWGPYKGISDPATDWRAAAQRAGNTILSINPHLLMFVEGVQLYPDAATAVGVRHYWWGSILSQVKQYPVVFDVPHQLVYSPHDWGPWKWNMMWFRHMSYQTMDDVWRTNWSYLLDDPKAPYAAPIWLGEFGTCTNNPGCINRQAEGNQAQWFNFLLRFLKEHPQVGWSFFALNGRNSNNHPAANGLLNPEWSNVASPALQADLAQIQHP